MSRKSKKELSGFERAVINRTRTARTSAEYNQEGIAQELGIPRATYANYEIDRVMDIELMPKFCDLTGITLQYMMTGKDDPLITAYKEADSDGRRLADGVLGVKQEEKQKVSRVAVAKKGGH